MLGLDVGTTTVRGLVYSESGEVQGQARATIQPIIPGPGCYEIDPDTLWHQVRIRIMMRMIMIMMMLQVVRDCLHDAGLEAADVTSMGISCQVGGGQWGL